MKIYGIELETPLIKGDANADKKVNAADIIEVANAIVSKPSENHSTFSRVVRVKTIVMYQCTNVPLGKFIFAKMGRLKGNITFIIYYIYYFIIYIIYNKPI